MSDSPDEEAPLLFDFCDRFLRDAEEGKPHPLARYLACFPGHDAAIAKEYIRLVGGSADAETNDSARSAAPAATRDPDRPRSAELTLPVTPSGRGEDESDRSSALLQRLSQRALHHTHHYRKGEFARGGMGVLVEIWDEYLRRTLAMKVILRSGSRAKAAFLEEAQVTGQLDHPGVVPVHELGVGEDGRLYFTMRLVKGKNLKEVLADVRRGADGWTQARALEVILKVCDTMAYAHSKGVVHRDIKPANVMVGRFGEVYVMDWGLARVKGERDRHDLRLDLRETPGPRAPQATEGSAENSVDIDVASPLMTLDGEIVGTPAYMPPEQAAGRVDEIGPRSDVYSVGAMLYQLLTGRMPYASDEHRSDSRTILAKVLEGPPEPVQRLNRRAPGELVAVCEKAMARDPAARYADMQAMALDLRAFLERRVVSAYEIGVFAELRKWVARNRTTAGLGLAGIVLLAAAFAAVAYARRVNADNLRLLTNSTAPALREELAVLWPAGPDRIPELERWLASAKTLVAGHEIHAAELEQLESRALPIDLDAPAERKARAADEDMCRRYERLIQYFEEHLRDYDAGKRRLPEGWTRDRHVHEIQANQKSLERLRQRKPDHLTFRFEDSSDQTLYATLVALKSEMDAFLVGDGVFPGLIPLAERALALSENVARRSDAQDEAAWARAIAAIRDPVSAPKYRGLVLRRQVGLVPVGQDVDSGLWEFAHLLSGAPAERDRDGRLFFAEETGIVLVLVPGGFVTRGSQSDQILQPQYDPEAERDAPMTEPVELTPFFVSKYEMTQAQWARITTRNASSRGVSNAPELGITGLHPIETVSFHDCEQVMRMVGLRMPSEAQWEYAARAGTGTPWWTGEDRESLVGAANLADRNAAWYQTAPDAETAAWHRLDDGFAVHAPVGSFRPNGFGLHDVAGNVREWCRDRGPPSYNSLTSVFTGERTYVGDGTRTVRGGSFGLGASRARSAARQQHGMDGREGDIGLRPSRELDG